MSIPRFFYNLMKGQWLTGVPEQSATFEGQIIIVTGGSGGLGLAAAEYLVQNKAAKVIITCRTQSKGDAAKKRLEELSIGASIVEVWELDLSSYDSIRAFSKRAHSDLDRLDVVISNAGVNNPKFELVNGIESNIYTNAVATILLSILLLPKLNKTATDHPTTTPHLVIVSSDTHYVISLAHLLKNKEKTIVEQLSTPGTVNPATNYPTSKLLDVLLTQQLAAHVPANYPVIINTPNPGLCYSELSRNSPGAVMAIMNTVFHARPAEVGARNYIFAASAGKESHGKYISEGAVMEAGPGANGKEGKEVGERLWKEVTELLEGIEPGLMAML